MNHRRIAAAAGMARVVSIPLGAFVHHGPLGSLYAANAAAFRPDPEIVRRLPLGFAVQLVGFVIAASMYARQYSGGRGILEGHLRRDHRCGVQTAGSVMTTSTSTRCVRTTTMRSRMPVTVAP